MIQPSPVRIFSDEDPPAEPDEIPRNALEEGGFTPTSVELHEPPEPEISPIRRSFLSLAASTSVLVFSCEKINTQHKSSKDLECGEIYLLFTS